MPRVGWNAAAVDELITYVDSEKSTSLIISQDNKLIVEKLWPLPVGAGTTGASARLRWATLATPPASSPPRKLLAGPSRKLIVVRTGRAAPDQDVTEKIWKMLNRATPTG